MRTIILKSTALPELGLSRGLIDRIDGVTLLVDSHAIILTANGAAKRECNSGQLITTGRKGELIFAVAATNSGFLEKLAVAFASRADQSFILSMPNEPTDRRLVWIYPIEAGNGTTNSDQYVALVSLRAHVELDALPADVLAELCHGMTETEAEIIARTAAMKSVADIAKDRSRAVSTVKNQKQSGMSKLRVSGAPELLRLMRTLHIGIPPRNAAAARSQKPQAGPIESRQQGEAERNTRKSTAKPGPQRTPRSK